MSGNILNQFPINNFTLSDHLFFNIYVLERCGIGLIHFVNDTFYDYFV